MSTGARYWDWVRSVTLGEFLGFTIPSVVGAASVALQLPQASQTTVMVLAGLGEGAVLGAFQARVLHRYISDLPRRSWIVATMIGAGIAWFIGMLPSTVGERLSSVPLWLIIPLGLILGAVLLLSIGVAQYVVLRTYVAGARRWIWANVVAWLAGLTVVFAVIAAAPEGVPATVGFSAAGGLGMAFVMALVTGVYARRALEARSL